MRFILKTIPKSEAKLLRSLLPSYVEVCEERGEGGDGGEGGGVKARV